MEIRLLNADEIEVRVQSVKKNGCILLLYKDARVDMKILDETFGMNGWQRSHEVINGNLFCNIDIWDENKNCWIRKQDVGVESYTDKEKGQASDSFKRAGFNVGIGRELYTSPFIWVPLDDSEVIPDGNKYKTSTSLKFSIKSIGFNDKKEINSLEILDNKGKVRYSLKSGSQAYTGGQAQGNNNTPTADKKPSGSLTEPQIKRLFTLGKKAGYDMAQVKLHISKKYGTTDLNKLTKEQYDHICKSYEGVKK